VPSSYYATGAICTEADVPPPRPDADQDGVPDEDDAFPNDPNESADSDGDGIGDNADVAIDDATNGDDKSAEGEDNGERDNKAEGGRDCNAPPSCSGDGIQCNQLFQQWSIRCSGAKVTGDPTICTGSYTCSGDTAQCAQVALARKTACAVVSGGVGAGGNGPGDDNDNGQPDWTEGDEPSRDDEGEEDDVTEFGIGISPDLLDREEIFGSGSCPQFPSFSIMGKSINPSADIPQWCMLVSVMRAVVLLMAAFTALRILMGERL
jgi:hypothetical protein